MLSAANNAVSISVYIANMYLESCCLVEKTPAESLKNSNVVSIYIYVS
jgi:hypothetical protein